MRILKKSKEKVKANTNLLSNSHASSPMHKDSNEFYQFLMTNAQSILKSSNKNLSEAFFDLEAEIEKGVCRDNVSLDLKNEQDGLKYFYI